MVIAAVETAEDGGNIANLMFSLILIFCGVLATKDALPGFWVFMYYLSPFSYLVSAMLSTGVANAQATCLDYEYLHFDAPAGQTCLSYMQNYINQVGGYILNEDATTNCSFCQISSTNTYLAAVNIYYKDRWRDFGIMWLYVVFNVAAALFLYWLVRVPKKSKVTVEVPPIRDEAVMETPKRSISGGEMHKTEQDLPDNSEEVQPHLKNL
jgi:ATP-binding cassette, subfamily G (WHITE), member 2, PDR